MSERRIKGSFSFKSDDGSLEWLDDSTRKWQTNGFSVIGKVGGESVILEVSQVSTTRFQDFFKLERFQAAEIATELHLAGKTFAARAIVSEGREGKNAQAVFMFKHQGKDYMLDIFRVLSEHDAADARSLHNDKAIRHALDTSFYLAD
jgi:hypothetical protein